MPFKRKFLYSGYDVLNDVFFAHKKMFGGGTEECHYKTFDEYYQDVGEEIYDDSCFFKYEFSDEEIKKYNLDLKRLNFTSLFNYTIDDMIQSLRSREHKKKYPSGPISATNTKNNDTLESTVFHALDPDYQIIHQTRKGYFRVKKYFDSYSHEFVVELECINKHNYITHQNYFRFKYIFDFIYFLKGDLSYASLGDAVGVDDYKILSGCNLDYALLNSKILSRANAKLTVATDPTFFKNNVEYSKTDLITTTNVNPPRQLEESNDNPLDNSRIYYVSDLHLESIICAQEAWTAVDINIILHRIVDELLQSITFVDSNGSIFIIDGDTVEDCNFEIFKLFARTLINALDNAYRKMVYEQRIHVERPCVLFILGDHELTSTVSNKGKEKNLYVINEYEEFINNFTHRDDKTGLTYKSAILLTNSLVYFDLNMRAHEISFEELTKINEEDLTDILKDAHLIFMGGPGFYYGIGIKPEDDKKSTDPNLFLIHEKVAKCAGEKQVIVISHYQPLKWIMNKYHRNFIYVHGHDHKNTYRAGEDFSIYGDNQYGQEGFAKFNYPKFKYFYVESSVDIFEDYADGIYDVSSNDYVTFLRGKWMSATYNRQNSHIKMIKRDGYYMFVNISDKTGAMCILNGGQMKSLPVKDIKYYYDHLPQVIESIDGPLYSYCKQQHDIALAVMRLGGSGKIHGNIIDIDFLNHIYFNFFDRQITPYFAYDITERIVYKDVETLLQTNCPDIYTKYLEEKEKGYDFNSSLPTTVSNSLIRKGKDKAHDTSKELYQQSRVIKKMEKIYGKVLTIWPDANLDKSEIEGKNNIKEITKKK